MKNRLLTSIFLLAAGALPCFGQVDSLNIPDPFVTDVTELLKGRVAGVEVISSVASPGMEPTVYVRGVGPLLSSRPLYVVDGVRVHSLEGLSPQDVESVEALRNGPALTLYGPEAADGVIVVRTRRAAERGFHVTYEADGMVQWPAWVPEGITIEDRNEYQQRMGWAPFTDRDCLSISEGTETSFSHRHHLAFQWVGDRLKAYAGLSYLDLDGPLMGQEWFRRHTGSWTLSWTPVSWLTVETAGNYGQGDNASDNEFYSWKDMARSVPVSRSRIKEEGSLKRRFPTFLTGAAHLEVRPLRGLTLRAGGGYSQNGMTSSYVEWWQKEGDLTFSGQNDRRTKWHWETEADYALTLGRSHHLRAGVTYRQRTEDYDLYSAGGNVPFSDSGVSWMDVPGFMNGFIFPEMEAFRASGLKDWGHLESVSPYAWSWKWDEASVRAGYVWRDLFHVDGSLFRATALGKIEDKEPLEGWSVSGEWNLASGFRGLLPQWWRSWVLRGSWGQTDRVLMNGPYEYSYYHGGNPAVTPQILGAPYREDIFQSVRREAGMDFGFRLGGDLSLSVTYFSNDDGTCTYRSIGSIGLLHTVLNRGWEFTGSWEGSSGNLRYVVGGNLTLYSNRIRMDQDLVTGFSISGVNTDKLWIVDGEQVGVARLYPFSRDNYLVDLDPHYYSQPLGEKPSYVGGVMPAASLGLHGMVGWDRWSLAVSGHGVSGNSILATNSDSALWKYYLDNYPDGGYYLMGTTAALFDGSFFRIDQVRLGYDLPLSRPGLNIGLYASLENFFLFTQYPGSDPEMALTRESFGKETATYPTSKRVVFGLKVGF